MDYHQSEPNPDTLTRKGYLLKDLSRNFLQALSESGAVATGKLMHFSSDFLTSGGLELWQKLCWDYAYDHIGVASPRIFYYLNKNFKELDQRSSKVSLDKFCRDPEVQQQVMECALILQMCPKRGRIKYPTIHPDTLQSTDWLRSVLQTTDKACVRKVYNHSVDQEQMLHAGNEMVYSILQGSFRSLFWVKWLEEEQAVVKKAYSSGLSTMERGPVTSKNRTHVGYYMVNILIELYKEMAEKGQVRLHQEYQALADIYRDPDTSQKHKSDLIAMMITILIEYPKMRVPGCPSLVQDSATLQRILQTSGQFFEELLRFPPLQKPLPSRVSGLKVAKKKDKDKQSELELKLAEIDRVTMGYLKM